MCNCELVRGATALFLLVTLCCVPAESGKIQAAPRRVSEASSIPPQEPQEPLNGALLQAPSALWVKERGAQCGKTCAALKMEAVNAGKTIRGTSPAEPVLLCMKVYAMENGPEAWVGYFQNRSGLSLTPVCAVNIRGLVYNYAVLSSSDFYCACLPAGVIGNPPKPYYKWVPNNASLGLGWSLVPLACRVRPAEWQLVGTNLYLGWEVKSGGCRYVWCNTEVLEASTFDRLNGNYIAFYDAHGLY